MKRVVFVLFVLMLSVSVYAQQGKQSVGFTLGYGFDSNSATLGLDYRYNITDEFRITPSLTHFVKNNGLSAWAIDMNAHYVFPLSDMFGFYPLAGLSLSFWDTHHYSATRLGANLGLGAELYATDQITIGVEVKYNIIKDFDQPLAGIRVGYNF